MADVILKDRSGKSTEYTGVYHVKSVNTDGTNTVFTNMKHLKVYYGTQIQNDDGTYSYTIDGIWFCLTGNGYAIADSSDDYFIIFTTKSLTIGETYLQSELGGV